MQLIHYWYSYNPGLVEDSHREPVSFDTDSLTTVLHDFHICQYGYLLFESITQPLPPDLLQIMKKPFKQYCKK